GATAARSRASLIESGRSSASKSNCGATHKMREAPSRRVRARTRCTSRLLSTPRRIPCNAMVESLEEPSQPNLGQYLRAIRRRGRLALVAAVVVLVVGIGLAFLLPAKYRSMATILIEQQEIPQDIVRSTITSYADQRIQLISQQVMTTSNLLDVIT